MAKALSIAIILAAVVGLAKADDLILVDGRKLTGTVTVEEDTVVVAMPYVTLRFPKSQVLRIDRKDSPEVELSKKLNDVSMTDADAVFEVARWAAGQGLRKQATELYAKVIALSPDHAKAHRELDEVKVEGKWRPYDVAVELARTRLEAKEYETLLKETLPSLEDAAAGNNARLLVVRNLLASAQLRSGDFPAAEATFRDLGVKAQGADGRRYTAIADILKDNLDGMYVLAESYPPTSALLCNAEPVVKRGPATLTDPLVLQAALRDRARNDIDAGRKLMEAAQKQEPTDPDTALAKYAAAGQAFDRADAPVPNLSRSYRVEIVRHRVSMIRKVCDSEAAKFDEGMSQLGKKDVSPQAYRDMILKLVRHLDNVRDNLKTILEITKPYSRDLVFEIKWAELDARTLEAKRQVLLSELDGDK